jgi:hypothetical protein
LGDGDAMRAISLAEIVHDVEPHNEGARHVLITAHEHLLTQSSNFWEAAWLRKQIADLS